MKTGRFILFLVICSIPTHLSAMRKEFRAVLLTNYTFSATRTTVGVIRLNQPDIAINQVKLTGKDAAMFVVNDAMTLSIRGKFATSRKKWFDITVETTTPVGKIYGDFRIVNDQFVHNKVIAHRGAWKNTGATENSIAALEHAIDLGCEGSEFDVHLSADSVLFIHHDASINGLSIEKTHSKVLGEIKLANGESLPTLRNYLEKGMAQNRTRLVLEIKPSAVSKERGILLTEHVVRLVQQLKSQAWIDYISFDYDICKKVLQLDPYANVAYLNGDKTPAELANDHLFGFDYHFSVLQKNENWIGEALAKNLTVNAWTVNDEPVMRWLLDKKVTFITTNEPEKLLKIVNGQ